MSTQPIVIDDTWATARSSVDGAPLVIRVRSHLQALVGHPALPNRLVIAWAYTDASRGMPTPEQLEALTACEDALVAGLEGGPAGPTAVLIGAWTGAGRREWVWYGPARECFEAAVNSALASARAYPLALTLEADPAWAHYTALLEQLGLGGRGAA